MALNLYRRHGSHCVGHRALHAMSYEADELRRSWKSCRCPIYASGTLNGRFKRRNTERTTWDEAKAVVRAWEDAGSWDGLVRVETPQMPPPLAPEASVTIERAIEAYRTELAEYAATSTQRIYGLLLKKLQSFSDDRGFVILDQWGPSDVREFRSSWSVSPQTSAKSMSTIKSIL